MRVTSWRAPVLVVMALATGVALIADPSPRSVRSAGALDSVLGATASASSARSDVWFCVAGTASDGGVADHRVTLVNTTDRDRSATVTVMAAREPAIATKPPAARAVTVAPYRRTEVRLAEIIGPAAYASAVVEIAGGGVLVEHSISNVQLGFDRAPCVSSTAEHWYVPLSVTGTEKNAPARALLTIFNPYRDDAVVDIAFSADLSSPPPDFKAFVVPARSVQVIDLNTAVPVAPQVAVSVIARTGRVAVERIEVFDDPRLRRDLVLTAGVAAASDTWVYPSGRLAPNRSERLVLYNTSDERVTATVEVRPDDRSITVEPFDIAIAPRRHAAIDLSAEARLADAKVSGYSLVVRGSARSIVTERLITVPPGQPGAGAASTTGAALASRQVFVDGGAASPTDASEFAVFNPHRRAIASVTLSVIADGSKQALKSETAFILQPGERKVIPFALLGAGLFTVVIDSTAPVMAEREASNNNVRSSAIGVASRADAATVDVIALDLGS